MIVPVQIRVVGRHLFQFDKRPRPMGVLTRSQKPHGSCVIAEFIRRTRLNGDEFGPVFILFRLSSFEAGFEYLPVARS
jgi:hypothetical protein